MNSASKNLPRGQLLHLRASLCTSIAACLGAISAPLATVFRGPLLRFFGRARLIRPIFALPAIVFLRPQIIIRDNSRIAHTNPIRTNFTNGVIRQVLHVLAWDASPARISAIFCPRPFLHPCSAFTCHYLFFFSGQVCAFVVSSEAFEN